jgi:hypothetical protein
VAVAVVAAAVVAPSRPDLEDRKARGKAWADGESELTDENCED